MSTSKVAVFDIGFIELLLVAVVALLALGPEKLPSVMRSTIYWIGKVKSHLQSTKKELELELDVDGINQQIHNELIMKELQKSSVEITECLTNPVGSLKKTFDEDNSKKEN